MPANRVLRTDWKRIGRSGATVDGREISPAMIDEMAASYNPDLFTALIWPEHSRWANYGKVEALRSEPNEEGGRDLFAVLAPNEIYISSNHYGQKLFTSMEITPNFRKTGKAYLTGLGATDDPASAATDEIRFSKIADQAGIMLTHTVESFERTFEDPQPDDLLDKIKALFFKTQTEEDDMADKAALEKLQEQIAALTEKFAALTPPEPEAPTDPVAALAEQFKALDAKIDALVEKFTAAPEQPPKDDVATLKDEIIKLSKRLDDALKETGGTNAGDHNGDGEDLSQYQ